MRPSLLVLFLAVLAGCAPEGGGRSRTLTERERDSTLATTPLPGAATVGRALEISDSAAARRARPLPGDN